MVIEIVLAVCVGLLAGGVVNVLADDLPLRRSVRLPRYVSDDKKRAIHMPVDDKGNEPEILLEDDEKRPVIAWLGITAFLFSKRTSASGVRLSLRYPLAELLTMGLMVITVVALNNNEDFVEIGLLQGLFWLIYMAILALITVIDIEHKLILFVVIIPFALITLLDALLGEFMSGFYDPSLVEALIGGVVGFVVFFIFYNGGFLFTYALGKIRNQEIDEVAFGYGDVMLATVSGLILGWKALIPAMFLTVLLGALVAAVFLLTRALLGEKYSAFTALPYGPNIVAGTILVLLYSESVGKLLGSL